MVSTSSSRGEENLEGDWNDVCLRQSGLHHIATKFPPEITERQIGSGERDPVHSCDPVCPVVRWRPVSDTVLNGQCSLATSNDGHRCLGNVHDRDGCQATGVCGVQESLK